MVTPNANLSFAQDLGNEVITIYVGPDRRQYTVHKKILISQSDHFEKALNGHFKEAEEGKIHLVEDDPDAVGLLILWLYRGVVPGPKPTPFVCPRPPGSFPVGNSFDTGPPIVSKFGTFGILYEPHSQRCPVMPTHIEVFCSYCTSANGQLFSPEELRLADYQAVWKYYSRDRHSHNTFPVQSPGPAKLDFSTPKRPGDFGYSPTIYNPEPEGKFLLEIPQSEPGDHHYQSGDEATQPALLHLCILAEKICLPDIFNKAVVAYVQGELNLRRDIPPEHVDLIYSHCPSNSTLRAFVVDSMSHLNSPSSHEGYMEVAQRHKDLLESLLRNYNLLSRNSFALHHSIDKTKYVTSPRFE